jgi:hypothetical protein
VATALAVPDGVIYMSLALVAGGTMTNALRRELPGMRHFRTIAFVAGGVSYAALIFATWRF